MRHLTEVEISIVSGGTTGSGSTTPTTKGENGTSATCPAGTIPVSAGGNVQVTLPGGYGVSASGYLDTCIP